MCVFYDQIKQERENVEKYSEKPKTVKQHRQKVSHDRIYIELFVAGSTASELTPTPKYTGVATSSAAKALAGLIFPNRAPAESAAAARSRFRRDVVSISSVAEAFVVGTEFLKRLYAFPSWIRRQQEMKRVLVAVVNIFMVIVFD